MPMTKIVAIHKRYHEWSNYEAKLPRQEAMLGDSLEDARIALGAAETGGVWKEDNRIILGEIMGR